MLGSGVSRDPKGPPLQHLAAVFLALLGSGLLALLPTHDRKALGEGFGRLIGALGGFALLLAAGFAHMGEGPVPGPGPLLLLAAGAAGLLHFMLRRGPRVGLAAALGLGAVACGWAGAVATGAVVLEKAGAGAILALAAGQIASSLLLGAALSAMICGHWYLIDRKLDFVHLEKATRILGGAVLLKASVTIGVLARLGADDPALSARLLSTGGILGLATMLRAAVGLVAPAVVVAMVLDCVARKSNQSATGLLYVLDCLVLTGETAALVLAGMSTVWL